MKTKFKVKDKVVLKYHKHKKYINEKGIIYSVLAEGDELGVFEEKFKNSSSTGLYQVMLDDNKCLGGVLDNDIEPTTSKKKK